MDVTSIVAERLGLNTEEIKADEALANLGMDSLDSLDLEFQLQKQAGIKCKMTPNVTLGQLLQFERSDNLC